MLSLITRTHPRTRPSAAVAQLAVQDLCKFKVVGSTPISGSKFLLPGSSAVEHRAVNATVDGSIPSLAAIALEAIRIGKGSVRHRAFNSTTAGAEPVYPSIHAQQVVVTRPSPKR